MKKINYTKFAVWVLFILIILGILGYVFTTSMVAPSSKPSLPKDNQVPSAIEELPMPISIEEAPVIANSTYGSGTNKVDGSKASFGKVRGHRYGVVSTIEELKLYNDMVTYVLFPKNKSYALSNRTTRRYTKVLTLIQELTKTNAKAPKNRSKRNNKFILMRQENESGKVTIDNYNYTLVGDILEIFENKTNVLFSQNGPYLITTMDNPFDGTDELNFLYVNLSHFNGSGITEILESYKRRLEYTGNSEFGFLEKLKAKILAFSMSSNDDIESFTEVFTTPAYAKD